MRNSQTAETELSGLLRETVWMSCSILTARPLFFFISFFLQSGTETLLKVCNSSKGIKHDWVPQCRERARRSPTMLTDFKPYSGGQASQSCWPLHPISLRKHSQLHPQCDLWGSLFFSPRFLFSWHARGLLYMPSLGIVPANRCLVLNMRLCC